MVNKREQMKECESIKKDHVSFFSPVNINESGTGGIWN